MLPPSFQGALDALKMAQALLLRIQGDRRRADGTIAASSSASQRSRQTSHPLPTAGLPHQKRGDGNDSPREEQKESSPRASTTTIADVHVHELAAQASRLRDMSRSVKGLLQLATGEVQGALDSTVGLGLTSGNGQQDRSIVPPPAPVAAAAPVVVASMASTQTGEDVPGNGGLETVVEELQVAETAARALQTEKTRLDVELGKVTANLGELQAMLRAKTEQVCVYVVCVVCMHSRVS